MFGRHSIRALINQRFDQIDCQLAAIEGGLQQMPTQKEFDDAMTGMRQAIAAAAARVVTDLQGKLAQGDPITAADLQQITDATAAAAAIDPAPAPVPGP